MSACGPFDHRLHQTVAPTRAACNTTPRLNARLNAPPRHAHPRSVKYGGSACLGPSDHYDMTMVTKGNPPNQVAAAEFKAKCLQVMDQVAKSKRPVIVTKRGKPMVRIVPVDEPMDDDVFGCLAEKFEIIGDIEEPALPARLWSKLT
jgi:prevent-host-death family protein